MKLTIKSIDRHNILINDEAINVFGSLALVIYELSKNLDADKLTITIPSTHKNSVNFTVGHINMVDDSFENSTFTLFNNITGVYCSWSLVCTKWFIKYTGITPVKDDVIKVLIE